MLVGAVGGIHMADPKPVAQTPEMDIDDATLLEAGKSALGSYLNSRFVICRDGRKASGIQEEWLQALLDFNGEYNATMKARMNNLAASRSRSFVKLARSVVGGARALIMQAYGADPKGFPWQISPAADPDLVGVNLDVLAEARDMAASQLPPGPREAFLQDHDFEDTIRAKRSDANIRCVGMSKEIQDNLDEMQWTERFLRAIDPLTIYGTAVFSGPKSVRKRWSKWHRDESGTWTTALKRSQSEDTSEDVKNLRPEYQLRDLWTCYPDPTATSREAMKDIFFRDVMSRHQVLALRRLPNVRKEVVNQIMADYRDKGNWIAEPWETQVESMTTDAHGASNGDRFVVLEFFGHVSGEKLKNAGVKVPDDLLSEEVLVNAMICDGRILKCVISNMEPPEIPVYFVPYEVVPQRLWGRGIPAQMDDSQDRFNAVERAKMDNLGLTAVPQTWIDASRIQDLSKADSLFPGKVWVFTDTEGGLPMGLLQIASIVPQCTEIQREILLHIQKETNLPDFALGIASSTAHNRTASGLSIQRDQALAFIRSVVGNIDVFLTSPMVRGLYDWNMSFNPNEEVKGVMDIVAKGVTGAVSREVIAERIGGLMHQWGDELKFWLKPDKAVPLWLDAMGLDSEGIVNGPKEAAALKEKESAMQAETASAPLRVQPTTPKENALMEMFQNTTPQSPMYGPIYEQVLGAYNISSERITAALDAINKAAASLAAPLIPPQEQAALAAPVEPPVPPPLAPGIPPEAATPAGNADMERIMSLLEDVKNRPISVTMPPSRSKKVTLQRDESGKVIGANVDHNEGE